MELKKSYKGFVIWMIAFCMIGVGVCYLPISNDEALIRIADNLCASGLTFLAFIIYKTEYVYWYSGISYEEAREAGSERRKIFAGKHLKRFCLFSLVFLVFSIFAQILQINVWIDIVILTVGFVAAALSMIQFKL